MFPEKWTLEKVKEGFEKFYELHKRYPAAYDVDDFDFLPSSRQIQRKFGGLVNLRKLLGLKIENYTQGDERSTKIADFNSRGRKYENILYGLLKQKFDEKFIHVEKPIPKENGNDLCGTYNSKDRYDFYIYAKPNNFAIDVFCTVDERGVINIMNMKENKYLKSNIRDILYFIYFGDNVNQDRIKKWQEKRKNKLPSNWKIMNLEDFKKELADYTSFKAI